MPPPGQSSNNPLPSKELSLFKKIIKCYEQKQYKIGLKCAKSILTVPAYAEHGETLAMKGLILNCMGKREEAMDLVKRGLKADIRSHVCWHVYGLVHRAEKKYDEAIKAYKMALRLDSDNLQIIRDLSLLQIQMRDLEGYKKSRYDLLRLRPSQKMSWIGYATAYHLLGNYEQALNIVNDFLNNNEPCGSYDPERSELILYQNMILRESGQTQLALTKLEENAAFIYDKLTYLEIRASLLFLLDRRDSAERVYRMLIDRNPESKKYYEELNKCLGYTNSDDDREKELDMLDGLSSSYPRASLPRHLALLRAEGDDLRRRMHDWITNGLRKGIPSLFKSLIPFYSSPDKSALIESLLLEYVKRIEEKGYMNGCLDPEDTTHYESPTTVVWLYALLSQHYDRLRLTAPALKYIDRALSHTPTLIELLMIKAKIHKHSGDEQLAARVLDEAQSLDTADRYINSKAAKYLLRAGRLEDAEKMCAKFTRENVDASVSLTDMQCMWYETEVATANRGLNKYGDALKMCHQVEQHFFGIYEDQFDFHTYCLRKSTLCAYIRLLRLEDKIRDHEFYYKAAKMAIKIYLRIVDRPGDIWPDQASGDDKLSAAELKKLKRRANKEKAKEAEKEKGKKEEKKKNEKKEDKDCDDVPVVILDGDDLLKCESPLEEAAKFAAPLLQLGCKHVTGYTLAAEVYRRKGKVLLMLQSLVGAHKLDPDHPQLHVTKIKFLLFFSSVSSTLSSTISEVAEEAMAILFPQGIDPKQLNESVRTQFKDSFPHRMAVHESSVLIDPSSASSAKSAILRSFEEKLVNRSLPMLTKLKDAIDYGRLGEWKKEEKDELIKVCHSLFPQSTAFGGGSAPPASATDGEECHHSFE